MSEMMAQQAQEEVSAHSQCNEMKDPLWELVTSASVLYLS